MKKILNALVWGVLACGLSCAAATYKVGTKATITLDEEGMAEYDVSGLSKGVAYTLMTETVAEEAEATEIDLVYYYRDPEMEYDSEFPYDEDSLGTCEPDVRTPTAARLFVTQDDWVWANLVKGEDYDPEFPLYTLKGFHVYLYGPPGAKVTLTSATGIVPEPVPSGCVDNPVAFGTIPEGSAKPLEKKANFIADDGLYCYSVNLAAGRRYVFEISGLAETNLMGTASMCLGDADSPLDSFSVVETSPDGTSFKFAGIPPQSGKHLLIIDGEDGTPFTVKAYMDPSRPIADHTCVGELTDGVAMDIKVGARNDSNGQFYDEIIDTSLASVELKAGRMAYFETEVLSAEECVLEVYDSNGVIVGVNFAKDTSLLGQAFAFLPPKSGKYYVGVCQKDLVLTDLGIGATPESVLIDGKLTYWDLGEVPQETDDKPLTGATLSFVLGDETTEGALQLKDDGSSHLFDATNHVDWYVLGARAGITYNLKTVTPEEFYLEQRPVVLSVYTVNAAGVETLVQDLGDATEGVEFTANRNTTYYVKATVQDGQGCYVPYDLYAWVSGDDYGFLKVEIKGATTAQWYLSTETGNKYNSGAEILLPAGVEYKIQCTAVTGWTKPADEMATVEAGNEGRKTVTLKYKDTADPKDDVVNGAVALAPTQKKPVEVSRSLWTTDPADMFKLTVVQGTYYGLKLNASEGTPVVTVYRDKDLTQAVAQGDDILFVAQERGTYYAVVTRDVGTEEVDAAYTLTATSCNVGSVKTDKTEYKVGEKAGYVTLKFSRTSKEGRVRVRYTTVSGTAVQNVHYMPATGVLEWADGDNKAQDVKIKLIPDLIDEWEEDRTFKVRIDAIEDDEFDETSEYRPLLAANEAKIVLTESSKAASGTVQFAFHGEGMEAFEKPTKPEATVDAGENAVLWVTRTLGDDKAIGVTVAVTARQTVGQEYVVADAQEIWWEDGDTETKAVRIPTMRPTDGYFAPQTFTVKLTAIRADGAATVKNGTATVTVRDGECVQTAEEYGATFTRESGVTLKAAAKDTWYYDQSGTFRSITPAAKGKAELTFTVPAPGHLRFQPQAFGAGATYTCQIDKEKIDLAGSGDLCVDRYLGGTAKVTVKLTVQRDATATEEAYIALMPQTDGTAFLWEPLTAPTLVSPKLGDKELVMPNSVHLAWGKAENDRIVYLLTCDKDQKKIGTKDALISSLSEPGQSTAAPYIGEGEYCTGCEGIMFEENTAYKWRVDAAMLNDEGKICLVATNKTVWAFKTSPIEAPTVALSGTDVQGQSVEEIVMQGGTVELVQGVKVEIPVAGGEGATVSLVSGAKLPDGVKLEQDRTTKAWFVRGVPTKVGDFYGSFQSKVGKVTGPAQGLKFHVSAIELATGTFTGLVNTEELLDSAMTANRSLGSATVTTTDAGKITAKVTVGATALSFTGTGWDSTTQITNIEGVVFNGVTAQLQATTRIGTTTYTNTLVVTTCRATTNDLASLDIPMTLQMTANMQADDKKTNILGVGYQGEARRDNTKFANLVALQEPFVGYYTMTLPVVDGAEEAPKGHGYLTLTVDAKGKVKIAGVLADGTAVSGSSVAYWVSMDDHAETAMLVPVYLGKGTTTFGGWVRLVLRDAIDTCVDGADIKQGDLIPVADSMSELVWFNSSDTSAYAFGEFSGFGISLSPVGGYYSTIVNLQTYYQSYAFAMADLEDTDSLPSELLAQLGDTYSCVAYAGKVYDQDGATSGLNLDLSVNAFTVDKTVLNYRLDDKGKKTKWIDWASSVNPCKFTMTFKQATGIFNGTMDIYAGVIGEDGLDTDQKKVGSFKHQGVLVMTRDSGSSLTAEDATLSGFYLAPTKIKNPATNKDVTWNASYRLLFGLEFLTPENEGWSE
ncbi:MAG: hypothetical protein MJ249_00830 [Kiritimatiellae bacterium]|nr:hypothetical protein [Kiritimatiellia bacterium]